MKRFLILFNTSQSASERMANSSPAEVQASMNEWMKWKEDLSEEFNFEWGLPLQHVGRVDSSGTIPGKTDASGYAIIEGEDLEKVTQLIQSHPHLKLPDATIDVFEMLSMSDPSE